MKNCLLFILFIFSCANISAQQLPQYTLFKQNPYRINPASAGMNNTLEITAQYRNQWNNLVGSPTQYSISGHLPLYVINSGIGFIYESDNIGVESLNKIGASASFVFNTPIGLVALSARGIYGQLSFNGSQLRTTDGNYEGTLIDHNDPSLPNNDISSGAFQLDGGLWLEGQSYAAGLSYNNFYHSGYNIVGVDTYSPSGVVSLYGEYNLEVIDDLYLSPAFLLKSDLLTLQTQLSINWNYKGLYLFGTELTGYSATSLDALGIHAGFKLNDNFNFVYQYGIGLSQLNTVHSGTHEVALLYSLGKPVGNTVLPKIIYNPRYVE